MGQGHWQTGCSGFSKECFGGTEQSQAKSPPHSGQSTTGNPPGSSGGKASTTMSSTQSAWLHERQRYLNHLLGHVHGCSVHSESGSGCRFIWHLHEQGIPEVSDDTVVGMVDQFQIHPVAASGTDQRISVKGFEEELYEGLAREDVESKRVRRLIVWGRSGRSSGASWRSGRCSGGRSAGCAGSPLGGCAGPCGR